MNRNEQVIADYLLGKIESVVNAGEHPHNEIDNYARFLQAARLRHEIERKPSIWDRIFG